MKAIQVKTAGGPENLQVVDVPKPAPGPKQALVKIAASGVNFIDVYHRIGLYKVDLPFTPGSEAAGTVEAVGPEVTEVAPGDRVAYAMTRGSYAEYAVVPAWQLVKIPDHLDFKLAAAAMLQGMTAHYLTHSTYPLKNGDICLVHAAAGGTGGLIVQMAKMLGARVFGTVSSEAKARSPANTAPTKSSYIPSRISRPKRGGSPAGAAWTWSTIPWAAPPSTRAWAVCGHAGRWRCSDNRAARCRLSTHRFSMPRDRSSSPAPASPTTFRRARNCSGAPAMC